MKKLILLSILCALPATAMNNGGTGWFSAVRTYFAGGVNQAETNEALMTAARVGNLPGVQEALIRGADVNYTGINGSTPLWAAIQQAFRSPNSSSIAQLLIERGANVNYMNSANDTPLIKALQAHQPDLARLLIERGADVNHANNRDETPLSEALKNGDGDMVKLLIQYGADINNALNYAPPSMIPLFIQHDANVNHQDSNGDTPLMRLAKGYDVKTAQFLIKHGADVSRVNNRGATALSIAKRGGSKEMVQLLREETERNARSYVKGIPTSEDVSTSGTVPTSEEPNSKKPRIDTKGINL